MHRLRLPATRIPPEPSQAPAVAAGRTEPEKTTSISLLYLLPAYHQSTLSTSTEVPCTIVSYKNIPYAIIVNYTRVPYTLEPLSALSLFQLVACTSVFINRGARTPSRHMAILWPYLQLNCKIRLGTYVCTRRFTPKPSAIRSLIRKMRYRTKCE